MIGPDLRALRKRLGMTQAQLAAALDISVSIIADYEAGRARNRGTPLPIPRAIELALIGPPIAAGL